MHCLHQHADVVVKHLAERLVDLPGVALTPQSVNASDAAGRKIVLICVSSQFKEAELSS